MVWDSYFNSKIKRDVLTLFYEDFMFDFNLLFDKLFTFLEIDPPRDFEVPEPKMKRQANKVNEEWIERMRPVLS